MANLNKKIICPDCKGNGFIEYLTKKLLKNNGLIVRHVIIKVKLTNQMRKIKLLKSKKVK